MRHYFIVSNVFRMSSKDIKNISFFLFQIFGLKNYSQENVLLQKNMVQNLLKGK